MLLVTSLWAFLDGARSFEVLFEPARPRGPASFWLATTRLRATAHGPPAGEVLIAEPGEGGWNIAPVAGLPADASVSAWALDTGQLDRTDEMLVTVSSHLAPTTLWLVSPGGGL